MKKLFLCLTFFALCGGVFLCPHSVFAADIIWSKANSPIVVTSTIYVSSTDRLIVESGTIVKFLHDKDDPYTEDVYIMGQMIARGTKEEPIIFTSLYDDSRGGDTDSDGGAHQPASQDWHGFGFSNGSSGDWQNVIINYGGSEYAVPLSVYSSSITLDNVVFDKNYAVINNSSGHLIIKNSSFLGNWALTGDSWVNAGITNNTYGTVEAMDNWWGSANGPCPWKELVPSTTPPWQIDFEELCGSRPMIWSGVSYRPWLINDPAEVKKPNPVILIPGILGSWPSVFGRWELDPILHTYDNLWSALKLAGYEEGKDLFALSYNWRKSNLETAHELKAKIVEVKAICNCDKVDLIGHSMGGLVARQYIESSEYDNDVDKMIFLATPHRGATKAYLMWEGGKIGFSLFDRTINNVTEILAHIAGYNSTGQYVRSGHFESVKELLPIYNYLRDKESDILRIYPDNYPANQFLENLNDAGLLYKLNTVKIYNFLGNVGETSTITNLRVVSSTNSNGDWINGYPENYNNSNGDHGLEYGSGDATVPRESNTTFAGQFDITFCSDHGNIVTDAQKAIIRDLTGKEPTSEVRNNYIYNLLMVRIFSPADFVITAPDGKKVGRNFASSSTINEIPLAFYNHDGGQFAVIPNPQAGEYKIDLLGIDSGSYRLSADYISDNESKETNYTGVITLGQNQQIIFNYSADSGDIMALQKDNITIVSSLSDVEQIYRLGWLRRKADKLIIDLAYSGLRLSLNLIDLQIAQTKQVRLQAILMAKRTALINVFLDKIDSHINKLLNKNMLNQSGYDIIKANNDYLKINL